MTSSQEPPLTRREIRERERLLEQQRAEAAAAQSTDASPPAPSHAPQPYPQQPRVPQPATSGAPQGAGYGPAPTRGGPGGGAQGQPPADRRPVDPRQAPQQRPPQGWGSTPPRSQGAPPQHYQNLPPAQRPQQGADDRGATSSGPLPPQGPQRAATTSGPIPAPAGRTPSSQPPQPGVRTAAPQPAPSQLDTPERTLTRRELRAMLDAHTAEGFEAEDEFVEASRPAPARGPAPQRAPGGPSQRPDERREAYPQPQRPPHQQVPSRAAAPHTTVDAGLDEPVAAPKPVGHWTSQLNLPDDREEPYDQLLSRGGSPRGVPTTTNALILPSLPDHGALGTPLAPSGEIMVTGSIDLPRSYGATGVHPSQIDSADVDRMFDSVEDVAGAGVAPVAATRAISTQGQNRAMMAPPSKEGMNVPLVLAVTAGVLALGVVATLVVGALAGLF
ncbi:hypothetical protein [Agromyces sp. ZXT2-6]|uniref:hypothetical protein n=1 Tax=Agromyces sp. ZXT2-6 TaxID=3461153 RepID=UPI004054FA43